MRIVNKAIWPILFVGFSASLYGNGTIELEVLDAGIYENEFNGYQLRDNNVVAGHTKPSHTMRLVNKTNKVKGEIGVVFGFRFKPKQSDQMSNTQVKYCGSHPPMKNKLTEVQLETECFDYIIKPNKIQWHTFVIENDWEIVPGKWSLYIEQNNKILAKRDFIIE